MPSVITGDPSAITSSLVRNISDASNTSPIVITTTVEHLFHGYDTVIISGVEGNTAANGTWTIQEQGSNTFRLVGSVGSGAYTSGGTAEDISLHPAFTIPSDGDPRSAASVNVAFESLADRTQYLSARINTEASARAAADAASSTRLGKLEMEKALNFTTSVGSIGTLRYALFEPVLKKWYAVGGSANCRSSTTQGWAWNVETLTGAAGTETCVMLDADPSGNLVVTNATSRAVFTYVASTSTWAKVNMAGGGTFNGENTPQVAYDPIHSLWCVLGYDSVGGASVGFTSPDRATWTMRSGPTWTGGFSRMACKKSTGRLVAVAINGTDIRPATSDDGGVSWTNRTALVTAVPTPTEGALTYNATENVWLLTVGEVSGTPSSEVWRSADDGVTWTKVATLAANALLYPAAIGSLWLAVVRTSSELAYSLDNGATWRPTGFALSATAIGAFASATQFLALSSGVLYPGLRANEPTTALLT